MFTSYEYLTAMRSFLLTVPFQAPYDALDMIDYGEIVERSNSDKLGRGNAIALTGDQIISRSRNVVGEETHNKRVNFQLIMWRDANDNDFQRDIANFLSRFINWVNEENAKRHTTAVNPFLPRFSMTDVETLTADGGMRVAALEGGRSEFSIQLHVDYQLTY